MFCNKCGKENDATAKFCVVCGNQLSVESVNTNTNVGSTNGQVGVGGGNVNPTPVVAAPQNNISVVPTGTGATRKALKKDAKVKPKGALVGAAIVAYLIVAGIPYILLTIIRMATQNHSFVGAFLGVIIPLIIVMIASIFISFGLMKSALKISRGEVLTFKQILKECVTDFDRLGKYLVVSIGYSVVTGAVAAVPDIGGLASLVITIYFLPVVYVYELLQVDKTKNYSIEDGFKYAFNVTKGHKVEFFGLVFSFAGWILLIPVTLGIMSFYVIPYMVYSTCNWYRRITGEVIFQETEQGMSDGAVIGVYVGVCVGIIILFAIIGLLGMFALSSVFSY